MAMATEPSQAGRVSPILVAISATRRSAGVLDVAAALARSLGAELDVMLVEDANLIRLADLPVTREIDRVSGAAREFSSTRLARAIQSEARRLRHELTRIRRSTSIRSTVRVVRGQVFAEALAASSSVDVTFVHHPQLAMPGESISGARARREGTLPESPRPWRARKPVWTLYEGGPANVRALRVADRLARVLESGLMVVIPCGRADETETRKREAREAVDRVDLRFVEVEARRSLLQERILTPGVSSLLVLPKQSRGLEDQAMTGYLESITVPLVLVA